MKIKNSHRPPKAVACCPSDVGTESTRSLWYYRPSPPPFSACCIKETTRKIMSSHTYFFSI